MHPIIQIMTTEWKDTSENRRQPRWGIFTDAYIKQACAQVANANPEWHADLYSISLTKYLTGKAGKKLWWVLPGSRSSAAQGGTNGMCKYLFRFTLMPT
jgi:hypothetical protein